MSMNTAVLHGKRDGYSIFKHILPAFIFTVLVVTSHSLPLYAETSTLGVLKTATLKQGDEYIHGLIFFQGSLWASTRTAPCRVLRIDLETLGYERIVLDDGFNEGEDLAAAEGLIWVILYGIPSRIVRIYPETLYWETALTFSPEEFTRGGSLEYAFGYLWAGGGDGKIVRVDPRTLEYEVFDFSSALGRLQVHALTSGGGYLWGSSPIFRESETRVDESIILRIDPHNPKGYAAVFLQDAPISDDMVYTDETLFAGSESSTSSLFRINSDLTYDRLNNVESGYLGCTAQHDTIWGALSGTPGKLVRHSATTYRCDTYLLPEGFNDANELALDSLNSAIFVTTWGSPARILKIRIPHPVVSAGAF